MYNGASFPSAADPLGLGRLMASPLGARGVVVVVVV